MCMHVFLGMFASSVPISGTNWYLDLAPMITDVNPFIYSHPIAPDDVIDRDDETRRLLAAAVGGHYVRLYAPRKYGKTSLLRRVLRDAEREEGMIPILVDFYGVLSVADVTIRFERAYARQLKGGVRSRIEEILQSTGLGLSLGALGISARLQVEPRSDPLPALHALLDLPLRLEEGGGYRALIVLDEFQDITKVKEMDALLRSHIQLQGEVASFVFAGSEPGLMRELFEDKERPLYGSAVPMRLEEGGGYRALIVLCDFQDITKVKEMDALLRSHIQLQGEFASFVFAGSEPGLMRELFEDKERPLYGSAVPMRLQRLGGRDSAPAPP